MNIRRATPADAEAMSQLHRDSVTALCSAGYDETQLRDWNAALSAERLLSRMESAYVLVDEEREELAGFCILDVAARELVSLYVNPEFAGRGVGRELMRHAEEAALAAGVEMLVLNSSLNAEAFYAKLGFERVKETSYALPSGTQLPCVAMQKKLR